MTVQVGMIDDTSFQCPDQPGKPWKLSGVQCVWCGDKSHPSSDCPSRGTGAPPLPPAESLPEANMDVELASFMNEACSICLWLLKIDFLQIDSDQLVSSEPGFPLNFSLGFPPWMVPGMMPGMMPGFPSQIMPFPDPASFGFPPFLPPGFPIPPWMMPFSVRGLVVIAPL